MTNPTFDLLAQPKLDRRDLIGRLYFEHGCDNSFGTFATDFLNAAVQIFLTYWFLSRARWTIGNIISPTAEIMEGKQDSQSYTARRLQQLLQSSQMNLFLYELSWYSIALGTFFGGVLHLLCTSDDPAERPIDHLLWSATGFLCLAGSAFLCLLACRMRRELLSQDVNTPMVEQGTSRIITGEFGAPGSSSRNVVLAGPNSTTGPEIALSSRASVAGPSRSSTSASTRGSKKSPLRDHDQHAKALVFPGSEAQPLLQRGKGLNGLCVRAFTEYSEDLVITVTTILLCLTHFVVALPFLVLGGCYLFAWLLLGGVVARYTKAFCVCGTNAPLVFLFGLVVAISAFAVQTTLGRACGAAWIENPTACALHPIMPHVNHNALSHFVFLFATPFLIVGGSRIFGKNATASPALS
ncbi:unnamed protein product [Amoebophrya sp. A120]|nr:unnamed protein product [Amoebophrya sp. A120]|eukprot:GSA120T00004748001.1